VAQVGIARTFQNIRLFGSMTALENVMVGRHICTDNGVWAALSRHRRAREEEARTRDMALPLATAPRGLPLDEPAAGMNAVEKQQLHELPLYIARPDWPDPRSQIPDPRSQIPASEGEIRFAGRS